MLWWKANKVKSFLLCCGCERVKDDTNAGCAKVSGLVQHMQCTDPHSSLSALMTCISRTSPGPVGPSIPAQLPWVRTYHSMSVQSIQTLCVSTELCHRSREELINYKVKCNLIRKWQDIYTILFSLLFIILHAVYLDIFNTCTHLCLSCMALKHNTECMMTCN